jgi:hypothetical protein
MLSKTSIRPLQTKTTSSTRLWRTTGTSFSTFGSPSKSWCRRRKIKTPASRKTITAKVNPTRSAGTPAGSITAIRAELFVIMQTSYRCFQSVAPTHLWDFPMPLKNGSPVPRRRESARAPGCAQTNGVPRRKRIPDQISTSKNRAHHATVGAQSRAVRSR